MCCSLLTWVIVFVFQLCSTDRWVMSCACWEGQEGISRQRDSQDTDLRVNCWRDLMKRSREQWEVREGDVWAWHGAAGRGNLHRAQPCVSHLTQPSEGWNVLSKARQRRSSRGKGSLLLVPKVSPRMGEASLSQRPTNGDMKMDLFNPFQKGWFFSYSFLLKTLPVSSWFSP